MSWNGLNDWVEFIRINLKDNMLVFDFIDVIIGMRMIYVNWKDYIKYEVWMGGICRFFIGECLKFSIIVLMSCYILYVRIILMWLLCVVCW